MMSRGFRNNNKIGPYDWLWVLLAVAAFAIAVGLLMELIT